MASTIVDLSTYGDAKGRDNYVRNSFFSVKGDGTNPSELTQGFYGVTSGASTTEYEIVRMTVSEESFDDGIGTLAFGVRDNLGTLNDVMSLNNVASEIATTTLTLTATDVIASGNINVGTIRKFDALQGSSIEFIDDDTDPVINFVLGTLDTVGVDIPLVITEAGVDVTGILTVGGVDILSTITGGNIWQLTGAVGQLKDGYTSIEINLGTGVLHNTTLALDVNGSTRIRGNDIFFYDDVGTAHYSVLAYDASETDVYLRASKAGDSVVIQTAGASNNIYVDRLTFGSGASTQNVTFSDSFVGIGGTSTQAYPLEVTGGASLTAGLLTGGDVDVAGNNLINVVNIDSDSTLTEQARIALTSHASAPQVDIILGDIGTSETTMVTITELAATINAPTTVTSDLTVTGNLTVTGTTVTINTSEISVDDINIQLANSAGTVGDLNGGGMTLGMGALTGLVGNIPSLTYNSTSEEWESSVGISVEASATLTVGGTTVKTDEIRITTAIPYMFFGLLSEWRLGIYNDLDGDHFTIDHDDGNNGTYITKFDVLE